MKKIKTLLSIYSTAVKKNLLFKPWLLSLLFIFSAFFNANVFSQVIVSPNEPCSMSGWVIRERFTSRVSFENGPGTPPLGTGSVQFSIGSPNADFLSVATARYDGILLSNITEMNYSTYTQQNGDGGQSPFLELKIDLNGDGLGDDRLFFEPVYQTGQGTLTVGTWQQWNALVGGWRSFNAGNSGSPLVTLQTYFTANPGARLATTINLGSFAVSTERWSGYIGNVDAVKIGINGVTTTYDFELSCPDTDNDGVPDEYDCDPLDAKNNKWLVCHNGHTICISSNALQMHLNHGDQLGPCANGNRGGVTDITEVSDDFKINVAPNPVISSATIKYELPVDSKVNIVLFDPQGKAVSTLVDGDRKAGVHNYTLDASRLPAGIYYYRMTTVSGDQKFVKGQKLMIIK